MKETIVTQENLPVGWNPLKKFVERLEKIDSWNEIVWPLGNLIFFLRPLHDWLIAHVAKIERGQKVLEVGAGYPFYKLYADKVGDNGFFVAVDINPDIQVRAKKICYWINNINNPFKRGASKNNKGSFVNKERNSSFYGTLN